MSDQHGTGIEWTHRPGTKGETWNPIRARNFASGKIGHYCVKVSGGCARCYAERLQQPYFGNDVRYAAQDLGKVAIFLDDKTLVQPLHWKKPRTVFVCSMTDLFGEWVPDAWIDRIFAVMALSPQHTFQILTKRPERMRAYLSEAQGNIWDALTRIPGPRRNRVTLRNGLPVVQTAPDWPLPNVWLGVSVEDQATTDERRPLLLKTPAAIRFVSYEPALGPVDFTEWLQDGEPTREQIESARGMHYIRHGAPRLDWIIMGGESGPKARPMHPDWARAVRDQCAAADVRFFFKQWGEWLPLGQSGFHHWKAHPRQPRGKWLGHAHFNDGAGGPETHSIGPVDTTYTYPEGAQIGAQAVRIGKKRAGRLLDGKEHSAFPSPEGMAREAA